MLRKISQFCRINIRRTLDCVGAFLLASYALIFVGPLGFLRGTLAIERTFWYMRVFIPMGVMARVVHVAIHWRLGHFGTAISCAEEIISEVEEYYREAEDSPIRRRVLADLYTILMRTYMHAGYIDEAMQVVLRAKKNLGIHRLAGMAGLDAKTAHLVRAGLAAGRMLEGGGLATLFVKTDPSKEKHHNPKPEKEKGNAVLIDFPPSPNAES